MDVKAAALADLQAGLSVLFHNSLDKNLRSCPDLATQRHDVLALVVILQRPLC